MKHFTIDIIALISPLYFTKTIPNRSTKMTTIFGYLAVEHICYAAFISCFSCLVSKVPASDLESFNRNHNVFWN